MDQEFDYRGCRICVRVREISGETLGFTTGMWRASVVVLPEGADWEDAGQSLPFGDPESACRDGEARGKAFIDALPSFNRGKPG